MPSERRRLPVVLDETDVVIERIDPKMGQRPQVDLLRVQGRRLEDDLKLVVVLEAVRVLAVPAVRGAARRLDVRDPPGLRPQDAEEGGGVERSRADLDIVRLLDETSFPGPERLQGDDNILKRQGKNLLFSEKKRGVMPDTNAALWCSLLPTMTIISGKMRMNWNGASELLKKRMCLCMLYGLIRCSAPVRKMA